MREPRSARTVSSQLLSLPNLLPSRTAALVPSPPTLPPQPIPMICRTRVWISTSTSTSLWTLEAGPADAHGVEDDVVPPHPPPPLLRTAGTHDHPDRPMLGFVIPEHDGVDHGPGAGVDAGRARTSPTQGPSVDLASPNRGGEGSINWRAGNVFGGAGAGTDTGAGEYAGNGMINPSVLGGGGNLSPERLGDDPSSPVRGFGGGVQPSGATDEDNEEEEDVMDMLFENTSDDDFMPPSGLGKGKGKGQAVVVDGIVELSEGVAAAAGSRMRRKSWRKELADEAEVGENNDSDDESEDDDGPRAHAVSAPVFDKCPSQETHRGIVVIRRAHRRANVLPPL
ncbi:hypothetical protein EDB84DRAFT_859804 [Lactarius hengduanensis]|nr:hypothetical protein EDB84DRAFT_859804 [Lactarius hengduanensis]